MNAKEKHTCENCKHYGLRYDNDYHCSFTCEIVGYIVDEDEACDGWTDPDEPELTEEERYDGGVMSNFDNENPKEVEGYINEGRGRE